MRARLKGYFTLSQAAPKWVALTLILVGFGLIGGVVFRHTVLGDPSSEVGKFWVAMCEHLGFELSVAGFIIGTVEYWAAQREDRIRDEFLRDLRRQHEAFRTEIGDSVVRALYGEQKNRDLADHVLDAFQESFYRRSLRIEFEIEPWAGGEGRLLMRTVRMSYSVLNWSKETKTFQPNPISVLMLPPGTEAEDVKYAHRSSDKPFDTPFHWDGPKSGPEPIVGCAVREAGKLAPSKKPTAVEVKPNQTLYLEFTETAPVYARDSYAWISLYPCDGLDVEFKVKNLPDLETSHLIFLGSKDADAIADAAAWQEAGDLRIKKFSFTKPLLSDNGFQLSWRPAEPEEHVTPQDLQGEPVASRTAQNQGSACLQ